MDGWLQQYASLTAKTVGQDLSRVPGAGAAGGLGFAFLAYLGGELSSGVSLVLHQIGLEQATHYFYLYKRFDKSYILGHREHLGT